MESTVNVFKNRRHASVRDKLTLNSINRIKSSDDLKRFGSFYLATITAAFTAKFQYNERDTFSIQEGINHEL